MKKHLILFYLLLAFSLPGKGENGSLSGTQIAFLSDIHLSDITGHPELTRTMLSQLQSTRLFNENYFAFVAAMDDIVRRDVKMVVLPGDLTDDGQEVNLKAMRDLLEYYSSTYGISFFATTGNHDPTRPFGEDYFRDSYLDVDGRSITISSNPVLPVPADYHQKVVVLPSLTCEGYAGIFNSFGKFGYLPDTGYQYWESPFTTYSYENYSFAKAIEQSTLESRAYTVTEGLPEQYDLSYLAEPVDGLWLLAIDGSIYLPEEIDTSNPLVTRYNGTLQRYNDILKYKKHLLPWIQKVAREAEKQNKTLIVFSHYPMIDFSNASTDLIREVLGMNRLDTHRIPDEETSKVLADAGIRLHFGGHIHINDTEIRKGSYANYLVNIQVPSLAAYMPAYKLLTIHTRDKMEIQTIPLDDVPGFKTLFPLYEKEYDYLIQTNSQQNWNKDILDSQSYSDYCLNHLQELVRLRFIPREFPAIAKDSLIHTTGKELMEYATGKPFTGNDSELYDQWTGMDWITDFYKIRSADKLAVKQIGQDRLSQYKVVIKAFEGTGPTTPFREFMIPYTQLFNKFLTGEPTTHIYIDLAKGVITNID